MDTAWKISPVQTKIEINIISLRNKFSIRIHFLLTSGTVEMLAQQSTIEINIK